jgi:hypothetical protein
MGIVKIGLVDEEGTVIHTLRSDPHALDELLPDVDDARFITLRFIDPFGDTTFNMLQWPFVLRELQVLREQSPSESAVQLIDELRDLLCSDDVEPHSYLKFFGD